MNSCGRTLTCGPAPVPPPPLSHQTRELELDLVMEPQVIGEAGPGARGRMEDAGYSVRHPARPSSSLHVVRVIFYPSLSIRIHFFFRAFLAT